MSGGIRLLNGKQNSQNVINVSLWFDEDSSISLEESTNFMFTNMRI